MGLDEELHVHGHGEPHGPQGRGRDGTPEAHGRILAGTRRLHVHVTPSLHQLDDAGGQGIASAQAGTRLAHRQHDVVGTDGHPLSLTLARAPHQGDREAQARSQVQHGDPLGLTRAPYDQIEHVLHRAPQADEPIRHPHH